MATGSLVMGEARQRSTSGMSAGEPPRLAAGLTIGSATALAAFFAVGEPWGTLNDSLSIGLAWATVPIAFDLARRHPGSRLLGLGLAADLIGVATTTVFTSLLISRRMTFEDSLQPILTGQAFIGAWLILAGRLGLVGPGISSRIDAGHHGRGGPHRDRGRHRDRRDGEPVAAIGFVSALVGTTGFYALLGRQPAQVR